MHNDVNPPPDATPPTGARADARTRRATASGWIGSTLEYYDFFIYAQAAALVFPRVFFPESNPAVALIASLATYAVGYLARPLGAVVLGHWGDRYGRKNVLTLAMMLMGGSTVAVALLPGYAQIGLAAPLLLVLLRLLQGFAVAGELGGASAMIVEQAPFGRRGYYASFALQGTQVGQVVAAAVFLPLAALLPEPAFLAWGWRIPFLIGVVVLIAGYLIRRRVEEPEALERARAALKARRAPIVEVLRRNPGNVGLAVCMALTNVIGTTAAVFGAAYATQPAYGIGMSTTTYLWIPILANVVAVAVIPYFGSLSDRVGRRPVMIVGSLTAGASAYGYLWAISRGDVVLTVVLAILMWGVLYQMWNATFASFFQELFPAHTRVTGFAVAQNLGLVVVSFMPALFTAVAPPGSANIPLVIGGITFGVTVVAAGAAFLARETHRIPLDRLGEPDAAPLSREEFGRLRSNAH